MRKLVRKKKRTYWERFLEEHGKKDPWNIVHMAKNPLGSKGCSETSVVFVCSVWLALTQVALSGHLICKVRCGIGLTRSLQCGAGRARVLQSMRKLGNAVALRFVDSIQFDCMNVYCVCLAGLITFSAQYTDSSILRLAIPACLYASLFNILSALGYPMSGICMSHLSARRVPYLYFQHRGI